MHVQLKSELIALIPAAKHRNDASRNFGSSKRNVFTLGIFAWRIFNPSELMTWRFSFDFLGLNHASKRNTSHNGLSYSTGIRRNDIRRQARQVSRRPLI